LIVISVEILFQKISTEAVRKVNMNNIRMMEYNYQTNANIGLFPKGNNHKYRKKYEISNTLFF
jgi:hypothetical protein